MNHWTVGNVRVTRIVELEFAWDGMRILPNATRENLRKETDWLSPAFVDEA
jgi:hypothetical protein